MAKVTADCSPARLVLGTATKKVSPTFLELEQRSASEERDEAGMKEVRNCQKRGE